MEMTSVVMKKSRQNVAGSWKTKMPSSTEPRAPMQYGAEHIKGGESRHPLPIGQPDQPLGLAETEGEAYLTKSCYNEYYPMHFFSF